jgi:hypothetical protein
VQAEQGLPFGGLSRRAPDSAVENPTEHSQCDDFVLFATIAARYLADFSAFKRLARALL